MATRALGLAVAALLCACTGHHAPSVAPAPAAVVAPQEAPAPVAAQAKPAAPSDSAFETSVKPILVQSCMPCHFAGGKMYERLPFDDPATIRGHTEGVLRRLKDPEKHQTVERWLATTR